MCVPHTAHTYMQLQLHTWSYTHSKKQQQDDKKAVERNRKELVRLDQQLKVSKSQYTKNRELNPELSRRLEEEKAETGDKEYTLKVHTHVVKQDLYSATGCYCVFL